MGKVKGSVIIPWVKSIRKDRSGDCDKYLSDEDRKVIFGKVLASAWYPYETYINCVNTVAKVEANGNLEKIRAWGREWVDKECEGIYKNTYVKTNPRRAIKIRQSMFNNFFDSIKIDLEEVSESEYIMSIKVPGPEFKPVFYVALGSMERGLELNGAEGLKAEFIDKNWEGASETRIRFSWTGWGQAEEV
ncbi:hypothetical protein ACFL2O_04920 [Thermodesulfobacteriota bacterium]